MDNLNIFKNEQEYAEAIKDNKNLFLKEPTVSWITETPEIQGSGECHIEPVVPSEGKGTLDVDGFCSIGWGGDDIMRMNKLDSFTQVPQADKNLIPMDMRKTKNVTNYCPMFDTSNVTSMDSMFCYCSKLTSVPKFDTRNVTSMDNMFYDCSSLTSVPQFDTSKVTDMYYMFGGCSNLKTVPQFDTSKVTDMEYMFSSCSSLTSVEFTGGVPSNCKCTDMFDNVAPNGTLKIHTGGSITRASYQPVIDELPSTWTVEEINDLK